MPKGFKTETELAKQVIRLLTEQKWTIYQEVRVKAFGGIADIVAVRGKLVHVVECKLSMGLKVMAQAQEWLGRASMVSVATPEVSRSWRDRQCLASVLSALGLGHIEGRPWAEEAVMRHWPGLNRTAKTGTITEMLQPEHQTFAEAGGKAGHWSVRRSTWRNLVGAVQTNPGATWKELLPLVGHHYAHTSSARAHLTACIKAGLVKGIELKKDGRVWRLFPKEREDDTKGEGEAAGADKQDQRPR